jgi:CRP-like cAMP-binding protein
MKARLEDYRPHLRSGKLTPQNDKVIYETQSPFDQVILPIEMTDFLLLCDGETTISSIVETLYHRKGSLQFKAIVKTLSYLKLRGFLVNGDEFHIAAGNEDEEPSFVSFKPLFEVNIGNRIFNESEHPILFYLLAVGCIFSVILGLGFTSASWKSIFPFDAHKNYFSAMLTIWFGASILLSLKNFFKMILLLFLTGRAYNFTFAFNGFAAYFRVKSDSLFLISDRLFLTLFHAANVLCPVLVAQLFTYFFPSSPLTGSLQSLSVWLVLLEFSPFQESEMTSYFRMILTDDVVNRLLKIRDGKVGTHVLGHFQKRSAPVYLFAPYSLLWSTITVFLVLGATSQFHSNLSARLKTASHFDEFSASLIGFFLGTLFVVTVINAFKVLYYLYVLRGMRYFLRMVRKTQSTEIKSYSAPILCSILESLPLFAYFPGDALHAIIGASKLKTFKPNTPVIVQGDESRFLFILLQGALSVRRRLATGATKNISDIRPITIFGESAIVESNPRAADVVAVEASLVLEVPADIMRAFAETGEYVRELGSFRNAISVNQFFASSTIFQNLSEPVRQMFITKGKLDTYNPDQIVFRQGDPGDGFYLLLRGSVSVNVGGRTVGKIQQGGFFGEISMIADIPRTATIYATETTQTLKVNREAFWEILSQDLNVAMVIESIGEMRVKEDIEMLKKSPISAA